MSQPLPVFFSTQQAAINDLLSLDEETSRHISQVLRMEAGEQVRLTDGLGTELTAEVTISHKKKTEVRIKSVMQHEPPGTAACLAVSLLKNASRFEWILEKVTEMGIREIYPLICERTEKQHFRSDRMKNILTSAMLQSQQHWLPLLHEPLSFSAFIADPQITEKYPRSFIAHCIQGKKESLRKASDNATAGKIILIGPEGDFSPAEISAAQNKNYIPVSLGDTRLRTETAAVTAAAFISIY